MKTIIGILLLSLACAAGAEVSWNGEQGAPQFADMIGQMRSAVRPTNKAFAEHFVRQTTPEDKRVRATDPQRLRVVEQYDYHNVSPGTSAKNIELTFVIDQDSPWKATAAGQARLLEEIDKTATILTQCSARVTDVYIAEAWFSDDLRRSLYMEDGGKSALTEKASPYDPPPEVQVVSALSAPSRPLALFVGDGYTHAFNQDSIDALTVQHPEARSLLDVVSVSWQIASDYQTRFHTQPSYSIVAHELVHVLGNLEHINSPRPNLMNSYDAPTPEQRGWAMSGDLLPDQCEAIRRFRSAF